MPGRPTSSRMTSGLVVRGKDFQGILSIWKARTLQSVTGPRKARVAARRKAGLSSTIQTWGTGWESNRVQCSVFSY